MGVPGLLLGGGIRYFGSQYGWSANAVVGYQVVLANSTIVKASATSYPDLFWALKGGSSNFGIVTEFEMNTYPVTEVYAGVIEYDGSYLDDFVNAVASFVVSGGGSDDVLAAIDPVIQVYPATGITVPSRIMFHRGPEIAPESFEHFTSIPTIYNDVCLRPNFASFADETNTAEFSSDDYRHGYPLIPNKS